MLSANTKPSTGVDSIFMFPLSVCPSERWLILNHSVSLVSAGDGLRDMATVTLPTLAGNGNRPNSLNAQPTDQAVWSLRSLPLATAMVDQVMALNIWREQSGWLLAEIARVLKPGGWLFVSVWNDYAIDSISRRVSLHRHELQMPGDVTLRLCTRLLQQADFREIHLYGIHGDPAHPSHLVPLGHSGAMRYFFRRLFVPHSKLASAIRQWSALLIAVGLPTLLFSRIAVVARRPLLEENDDTAGSA